MGTIECSFLFSVKRGLIGWTDCGMYICFISLVFTLQALIASVIFCKRIIWSCQVFSVFSFFFLFSSSFSFFPVAYFKFYMVLSFNPIPISQSVHKIHLIQIWISIENLVCIRFASSFKWFRALYLFKSGWQKWIEFGWSSKNGMYIVGVPM